MNQNITIIEYFRTAIVCTIAYCIPILFFFRTQTLADSWILYIGNIAFIIVLSIATYLIHKRLHDQTKMGKMIAVGMKLTIFSSLFAIPVITALYYTFGYNKIVNNHDASTMHSILYILFLSKIVVNILIGFIVVILVAIIYNQIPKNIKGEEIT